MVGDDDGRSNLVACGVDHVAEAVQMAFDSEEFPGVDGDFGQEVVTITPGKGRGVSFRDRVSVAKIEGAGIGVLGASLGKSTGTAGNRDAERLAAEGEELAASMQVAFDSGQRCHRYGGTIRQDEQIGAVK